MGTTARIDRARSAAAATVVEFERIHGQVLFGFVRRLGVSDDAAVDVVQDALLKLFAAVAAGEQLRDAKAWTFHIAYRLAMDEHRRASRRLRIVPNPPEHVDDPSDEHARHQVWAQVDLLPERQRAVLYLRFRADLPFDAIGTTLGISASAARSHCTQALATLRRRCADEEGGR
jgi:RNA polymerase sigma factor (sigma-70 family)